MAGSITLTRACKFCKQKIKPWSRKAPEYCCDAYRDVIGEVLEKAMTPPEKPAKKPHPFTGRKGPL